MKKAMKLRKFIKDNKLEHICGEPQINTSKWWEVVWEYVYLNVGKKLYLKYFTKHKNFAFQIWDKVTSQFTKDWEPNILFEWTIEKLQKMKAEKPSLI